MARALIPNEGIYRVSASPFGATEEFSQLFQNHLRNDSELATQELKIKDAENRKAGAAEHCADFDDN